MEKRSVQTLAREAGWRDTPTVRDAFSEFDMFKFANDLCALERESCAQHLDCVVAYDWERFANGGPAGTIAACAAEIRKLK